MQRLLQCQPYRAQNDLLCEANATNKLHSNTWPCATLNCHSCAAACGMQQLMMGHQALPNSLKHTFALSLVSSCVGKAKRVISLPSSFT